MDVRVRQRVAMGAVGLVLLAGVVLLATGFYKGDVLTYEKAKAAIDIFMKQEEAEEYGVYDGVYQEGNRAFAWFWVAMDGEKMVHAAIFLRLTDKRWVLSGCAAPYQYLYVLPEEEETRAGYVYAPPEPIFVP
ncbi:MAG: hypothetical protein KA136_01910 [Candidatus Bipolaricaulis sp.]|nr:hypothetical protein [Candidatus Bipolaricaulis sp.]